MRIVICLALFMGSCAPTSDRPDPLSSPTREPDLVAYYKPTITEQEVMTIPTEVDKRIRGGAVERMNSSIAPEKKLEVWFSPDATDEDRRKLREFLNSSPVIERFEERSR